jgi:putative phosphonate catabolism associated alcohol dehydrogenase
MARAGVFLGPGAPLETRQLEIPVSPGRGEILVAIDLATICGSDLHTFSGQRREPTPLVLGHEAVGRVVAAGPGRESFKPGQRVTWSLADSCGSCLPCTRFGLPQKCDSLFKYGHASLSDGSGLNGCYSSHILLRAGTHVVTVPDVLSDPVVAPANCALSTVMHAASRVPAGARTVLVQGAGLLGLYACAVFRERGAEAVFCIDIDEQRLLRVTDFGGIPLDGRSDYLNGLVAGGTEYCRHGVDAVIEVAGHPAVVPAGLRALRPGGTYILAGMVHPASALDLTGEQLIRKCATMTGVHNYMPRHLDEAIEFLTLTVDRYPYAGLVSPPWPLEKLSLAVEEAGKRTWPRVSVSPRQAS